jgi:chemotaxis family two-component system response regulator Rcp1
MPNQPIEILLVEDNPAEIRLTIEGLKEGRIANRMHSTTDGDQALDFLFRRGPYKQAMRPDLVLLDLNLPGIDGRTVLRRIKGDPSAISETGCSRKLASRSASGLPCTRRWFRYR